jgi:hypothetical protein
MKADFLAEWAGLPEPVQHHFYCTSLHFGAHCCTSAALPTHIWCTSAAQWRTSTAHGRTSNAPGRPSVGALEWWPQSAHRRRLSLPPAERRFSRTGVPNQCLRAFLHSAQPYRTRTARAKPMNATFPSRTGSAEKAAKARTGGILT